MSSQKVAVNSIDPIKALHPYIWENIFVHLSGNEVKKFSLISSDWKKALAESRVCSSKLTLFIDDRRYRWTNMTDEERAAIVQSRKFDKISIYEASGISESLSKLMSLQCVWKKVFIGRTEFSSVLNFIEFIEIFRENVEDFTLRSVTIERNDHVESVLHFPMIKKLLVRSSTHITFQFYCPVLEILGIVEPDAIRKTAITNQLMTMKRLKTLYIQRGWGQWFGISFNSEHKGELPHQLKDFENLNKISKDEKESIETFKQFLINQSHRIVDISLMDSLLSGIEVWNIIFGMKSLKKLSTKYPPNSDRISYQLFLPKNYSIETLNLRTATFHHKNQLLEVLKASTNVKKIAMPSTDTDIGHFIQTNLSKLEELTVYQSLNENEGIEQAMPSFEFKRYAGKTKITRKLEQ